MRSGSAAPAPSLAADAVNSACVYAASWLAYRRRYLRVPGVQAAVLFDGDMVLSRAYGHADVETQRSLTTEHLFRVASHSKTFTATAILQLFEARKLRLDDRAADWLPFLSQASTPVGDVTIRELLSHSGGVVRDGDEADFWQLRQPFPNEAGLQQLARAGGPILPPNERFKYSNVAYGLLGAIIEAASGRPYDAYVREEVVHRLGLRHTGPDFDPARREEYVVGYSGLASADERVPVAHVDTAALAAATGFYSTAKDLCRYAAAHFWSDERLLTDASKRLMQRESWPVGGVDESGYGLGFSIIECGDRRLRGHGGGFPGHTTRTVFDADARLAVSVLTNAIDGPAEELAIGIVKVIDLAARPGPPPGRDIKHFCVRLANLWGVRDVARLGERLYLLNPALAEPTESAVELTVEDDVTLRATDGPGFAAPGELMHFELGGGGVVRTVRGPGGMTWWPIDDYRVPDGGVPTP